VLKEFINEVAGGAGLVLETSANIREGIKRAFRPGTTEAGNVV
jgi:hypothetical protein